MKRQQGIYQDKKNLSIAIKIVSEIFIIKHSKGTAQIKISSKISYKGEYERFNTNYILFRYFTEPRRDIYNIFVIAEEVSRFEKNKIKKHGIYLSSGNVTFEKSKARLWINAILTLPTTVVQFLSFVSNSSTKLRMSISPQMRQSTLRV